MVRELQIGERDSFAPGLFATIIRERIQCRQNRSVGLSDRRRNLGEEMPRYLIERAWDELEDGGASKGRLSKRILSENPQFSPIVWEHSHVVIDEEGQLKSFCVYSSPSTELIREHAELLGDHTIGGIYEIGGDISPGDFD